MIKSKVLNDGAWKDVLSKNKTVKDNGLLKTLSEIRKLGDDDHEDAQKILDQIQKLAAQLKKSKEIAAAPAVSKFLAELTGAADIAVRDVAKAKADAAKTAEAKAQAEKKAKSEADRKTDDDEDEDAEPSDLLTTKLKPLLRQVAKGERMHALLAKSGKQVVVMLSRKPIPPTRRKMLADQLGGGSTKYYPGHCHLEAGAISFVLKAEVAGMAKLVKAALLEQTGLRLNKIKCRGEDGDDDDEDENEDDARSSAPSARGEPGDEGDDASGEADDQAPAPPPVVEAKVPLAELEKAPQVWKGTRAILQKNIDELKKAVQAQVADEEDLVDEIEGHLQKLDRIMAKLDKRLTNSLTNAVETQDPGLRSAALRESKGILAEYIRYVSSEPLIAQLDSNPFGVKTDLKATLSKSLTQLARTIG
jgi:hypothetical protein